jgi:hypothetical protein
MSTAATVAATSGHGLAIRLMIVTATLRFRIYVRMQVQVAKLGYFIKLPGQQIYKAKASRQTLAASG